MIFLVIARPSPLPPSVFLDSSALTNSSKTLSITSSDIPIPLSSITMHMSSTPLIKLIEILVPILLYFIELVIKFPKALSNCLESIIE